MSGGQRQRVAMGRAIVRQPKVFLFDEPLSNLDARLRTHMRMELGRLHRELGATSLYVTDQVEAMTLADRIVLMRDGIVQQVGAPMDLYSKPENVFVAGFIGHPTMNILDGTVTSGQIEVNGWRCGSRDGGSDDMAVTVGIRPHDLTLVSPDCAATDERRYTVDFIEPMGHETLIHLRCGELTLRALSHELTPRAGDVFCVRVENACFHLFDANTEARL